LRLFVLSFNRICWHGPSPSKRGIREVCGIAVESGGRSLMSMERARLPGSEHYHTRQICLRPLGVWRRFVPQDIWGATVERPFGLAQPFFKYIHISGWAHLERRGTEIIGGSFCGQQRSLSDIRPICNSR